MLALPALMLLGLPADIANGTNRLAVVTQTIAGVAGFHAEGKLELRSVPAIALPTIAGAILGATAAALWLPREWVKPALLATMVLMATVMLVAPRALAPTDGAPQSLRERPVAALGLFAAGVYGGFVQAGVGFVLLAVLGGLLRYDLVRANALKLACVLAFGLASLAIFVAADQVDWAPAVVLALATVVGARLGVRFAINVRPGTLRVLIFVGVVASAAAAWFNR